MVKNSKNLSNDIPWVEKYRPKTTKEMGGSEMIIAKLQKFLDNFDTLFKNYKALRKAMKGAPQSEKRKFELKLKSIKKKLSNNKAKLLIGPPGVGKTTIVYALAKERGLSVIELNASDARTEDALKQKLAETVKSTNLLSFTSQTKKGKIILIDEVDGIHGQSDRGGVSTLVSIINSSKYPVIMTCNFRDDKRFKQLYELASPLIEVEKAKPTDMAKILVRIANKEGITIDQKQIKTIVERSNGDFRSSINDLQSLSQGTKSITEDAINNINMSRDTEANIQKLMINLFQSTTILEAKKAVDEVQHKDINFRVIHKWINENILNFISNKKDLMYAFDHLAHADQILGYILRTQDYQHLRYFYDILAGGVRLSKSDLTINKNNIRPPRWFRLRAASDDKIAIELQKLYRASLNEIMRNIKPNLKLFIKYDPLAIDFLAKILREEPKKIAKLIK
jgi:replication factor C large subunit